MTKIQVKRGLEAKLPTLSEGEPGFTTDTEKVFIGSSNGNIELAKTEDVNKLKPTGFVPNNESWISSDGQDTFQITNGTFVDVKLVTVTVGGVIQPDITLVNDTTFQLPETLSANIDVYAEWFETPIPVTQGHHKSHENGGQDAIDIINLKNYQNQVAAPINVLMGLNDYRIDYTYSGNVIQTETIKDKNGVVVGKSTYSYVNNNLDTSVLVMNGQTITSKYTYDTNGNLLSIVNTKS